MSLIRISTTAKVTMMKKKRLLEKRKNVNYNDKNVAIRSGRVPTRILPGAEDR